jgi:hypothetical protein
VRTPMMYQGNHYNKLEPYHKNTGNIKEIDNTINHLESLIKEIEESGILEAIQKLGPDMLGAYFLKDSRVELY